MRQQEALTGTLIAQFVFNSLKEGHKSSLYSHVVFELKSTGSILWYKYKNNFICPANDELCDSTVNETEVKLI